ncbi:MAG: DUF3108 domain-containing protein [Candidatus Cloacimonadaceae bacterium]|jgi:hypothetical protein|nr:DUF3108 domain-containing protein [Candidatus Cloacimonadota bacterium]MDY0126634.1 DUF3108 domain-containing protein [Candidatus Cloacimonadaceae bacterium]MCB5255247.1 DUF3108 domain-containing protein [Candidatus Cloacimonadota bacterium]MCK9177469.1 DUF3108 domain-containing protein [Candidatus Cloacimonadota bacterium]MCK9242324.1 DUF3108 domain-containing protein [Candidatus Cloacimonadota bacterium]
MKKLLFVAFLLISLSLSAEAFMDGEKLTFKVKYGIISAAEATLEARTSVYQGTPVWYLTTNAKTYSFFDKFFRVRDRVESWWDKESFLPHKFAKNLQEGNYRQHRVHIYDHPRAKTTYQRWSFKEARFNNSEMDMPGDSQDILSAFYYVRNQDLKVGKSVMVNITADGRNMPTEVMIHRKETVKSIFGEVECLVIEPILRGEALFKQTGNIYIWITNDQYKIPVKLESKISFGSFVATLESAQKVPLKLK